MVLGGKLDPPGGLESSLRFLGHLGLALVFLLYLGIAGVFVPPVETDGCLQNEENIVPGLLDFADRLGDPVGLGKGIVDRVSQFLHEVLQWLVHRYSLNSGCAPVRQSSTTG